MNKEMLNRLESVGPQAVLLEIAHGKHGASGSPLRDEVEAWLRSKQIEADKEASTKRDAREEETLAIARSASRWSMWAVVVAILAIIIAVKNEIFSLIFGQP